MKIRMKRDKKGDIPEIWINHEYIGTDLYLANKLVLELDNSKWRGIFDSGNGSIEYGTEYIDVYPDLYKDVHYNMWKKPLSEVAEIIMMRYQKVKPWVDSKRAEDVTFEI